MELIVLGLVQVKDPYKDGVEAVCAYLRETADEMQGLLEAAP